MAEFMCELGIENFCSEKDDFQSWVALFEKAIKLRHPSASNAEHQSLCMQWIPLKLDDTSRTISNNVTATEWGPMKEEMGKLMVNPEDKYNWLARRDTITWDGKESLHALATRIKQKVDKFDPDNGNKEREYFIRFRWALPLEYKRAIDMNCGEDRPVHCTLKEAKTIALRLQMANAEAATPSSGGNTGKASFIGASMSDSQRESLDKIVDEIRDSIRE